MEQLNDSPGSSSWKVLLVEPDLLVAEDLCASVKEFLPGAEVSVAANEAAALDVIRRSGPPALAILSWRLKGYPSGPGTLVEALANAGARVALLGVTSTAIMSWPADWHLLPRPFAPAQLRRFLSDAGGAGQGSAPV